MKQLVKMAHNVLRLAAGGAFKHHRLFGKPHFNYTKKLSSEALHPRFCKTAVVSWPSVFRPCQAALCKDFAGCVGCAMAGFKIFLEGEEIKKSYSSLGGKFQALLQTLVCGRASR